MSKLVGLVGLLLATLNTVVCSTVLLLVALLKLIVPIRAWRDFASQVLVRIAEAWISVNTLLIDRLLPTSWSIDGLEGLRPDLSYLVLCNHQSWVDIVVLQKVFNRRIPFMRFFLKRELIWVPLLGLAWWALDFPFVRRYSREFLQRHPELRGKDLEITRKACDRFKGRPVSIMNFVEGTRFTTAKHSRQQSPYRHLLKPKSGGVGFALGTMGEQIDGLLDITIVYPGGVPRLWDLASGRVPRVIVHVQYRDIPADFSDSERHTTTATRNRLRAWIEGHWKEKDARIAKGHASASQEAPSLASETRG